ncbi:putative nucleic acid-binding Zn-ribbon protein [Symbiobacterium terraclitae]|uniref:Nucleic acid-binding Zn-ribbon protein n=1 Tax=Symbiobacterium terraclitae TaxID=557451 RepID=A0ABS4JTZ8_9FIRM|nr:hypothetical protein [Symbiobacterium terraclitae]MBP2019010.1 putative nucleic acid-binding Zn-ribbon protein [Symbiobacterium terraclitae]
MSALERTAIQHDKRIGALERKQAAAEATAEAMQQDIREAKEAAQHAARGIDSLRQWMLATIATVATGMLMAILNSLMGR